MRNRYPILAAVFFFAASALIAGDPPTKTDRFTRQLPLDVGGSFWIDNPSGSIEITGSDKPGLSLTAVRTVTAADDASLTIGLQQTQFLFEGDEHVRVVKTVVPVVRAGKWRSTVDYTIRVPRSVHVKISSTTAKRIRIANISGNVTVRNFSGLIVLDGVPGSSIIDTVNGTVVVDYSVRPSANAQLSTVNGNIEVRVPADSNFNWVADTIRGDFLTSMPVRGGFNGSSFRGSVNSPGGPTLTTVSMMGRAVLLRKGTTVNDARSVQQYRSAATPIPEAPTPHYETLFQAPLFDGNLVMSVPIGSIEVGEVKGFARVDTGAGRVKLGVIYGEAAVVSLGGPLDLGDVYRTLTARTEAGDILVRGALGGGNISTGGGNVRLLYNGGPTTLRSGGGDIVVRQAAAAVEADTHSGDITITADPNAKSLRVDAKTEQGNVVLNVTPGFAADVDATVLTSDPDVNAIHSDFPGLTIRRDQVSGKTRIRATGKINGGGEKVQLFATDGNVHIVSQTANPITVVNP